MGAQSHWLFRKKDWQTPSLELAGGHKLKKSLGVWDLTAFGVAAIIGAGVFSTIGNVASQGGPAVVFLYIFTALCCAFSALCYAQFASSMPGAGSAYTYAYASFGELIAWVIGWDLLMEYSIGNIAVAISWSGYFTAMLESYGLHVPQYLTMDFLSAHRAYDQAMALKASGAEIPLLIKKGYEAWVSAPYLFGIPIVCDVPAFGIVAIVTSVVFVGIEESRFFANAMVLLKIAIVALVIIVGGLYVNPQNWQPFNPEGVGGVLKGVSGVFFAYIGFDAISTAAEECKNPQRDLPRGMIYSLAICTVLYVLVALVLTGLVPYKKLGVEDPLAYVFGPDGIQLPWINWVVGVGGIIALATVLLVFQLGQPRICMAMSRDGLLPPIFSSIHPRFKTPWFSTLATGVFVAVPALFMNITEVTDLTSIGTLFAFVLVSAGVLRLEGRLEASNALFKIPYINSKYIFPSMLFLATLIGFWQFREELTSVASLQLHINDWLLRAVYYVMMLALSYLCYTRNFSLIPVLGFASSSYLMCELGLENWIRFGVWLLVGFCIYFLYSAKHSKLANR